MDRLNRTDVIAAGAASAALPVMLVPDGAAAAAPPVPELPVELTVNGTRHRLRVDPRTTLVDLLRNHLRLTGTKIGCNQGQCGACTVLVDGVRVVSCLSLAVMHRGQSIVTVEGLGTPERLHPVQAAFVKHDGLQCGFCTPGQICSAVGTLAEIREGVPSYATVDLTAPMRPTTDEIRERMSGNLCRCGAYSNIDDAMAEVTGVGYQGSAA